MNLQPFRDGLLASVRALRSGRPPSLEVVPPRRTVSPPDPKPDPGPDPAATWARIHAIDAELDGLVDELGQLRVRHPCRRR
ncbi:hypothetical protein Aple_010500 [Acrocarpospora pleiomorpha]|uniref:Uncharacterized protein n=1 Tax=Acrocarpospora pleiomorpha TaxID=90975 RepID=A0A5M3X8W3_9ACTN|nr:hypothetical protein [Acrocarpospora pleiomorpha]GES18155.1 hypothetical protein Aple_010500 [Acrocarpospora pleiomorpha]